MSSKSRLALKTREDYIPYAVGHVMRSDDMTKIDQVLDEANEVADPFKHMDREELAEFVENLAFSFSVCHANGVPKTLNDAMCALCDVFFDLNGQEPLSMDEYAWREDITTEEREFAKAYSETWNAYVTLEHELPKVYDRSSPMFRKCNWHYVITTDFNGVVEHLLVQADDDEHALEQLDDISDEHNAREYVVALIRTKDEFGVNGILELLKKGQPS